MLAFPAILIGLAFVGMLAFNGVYHVVRKHFPSLMGNVDHIRATHDLARNAYSRGVPAHGAELADDLERLVALKLGGDASIAAGPANFMLELAQILTPGRAPTVDPDRQRKLQEPQQTGGGPSGPGPASWCRRTAVSQATLPSAASRRPPRPTAAR